MKINLNKAIKTFYPNPSFEQVYFEAIANSVDAGATEISVTFVVEAFDKPDTLRVKVEDNGRGFTDEDFEKFSRLLEVTSEDHKGLGRLVYLAYFNEIKFESAFEGNKIRTFEFNSAFNGESKVGELISSSGTKIEYRYFSGEKVKSYAYLTPAKVKDAIIQHFFPLFFSKKTKGEALRIELSLDVKEPNHDQGFFSGSTFLTLDDLPKLETAQINDASLDFFQAIDIFYSVTKDAEKAKSITTSICIDGRAIDFELVPLDAIPATYQLVFFFRSDFFIGKTNSSRQRLELPDEVTEKNLKATLRKEVGKIIAEKIPAVVAENDKTIVDLDRQYPHLSGYYPLNVPGLIVRNSALEEAQKTFFNEQRKVLECEDLDDARYAKAVEMSARALMEYVLYRARIIGKLKGIKASDAEKDIHRLIIPMKRTFRENDFIEDLYNNNVWMLDDKYMSYNSVLSDQKMSEIAQELTLENVDGEGRPDITLVFSSDPLSSEKVSVVVIELKKHGVKLAEKEEVVSQLRQRARRLLKAFPNKIERIWFYGITEIDQEFRYSLKEDEFKELFSHGQVFYKPQPIIVDDENSPFLVDLFVMTYDAFIHDAESRNETFVRILKSRIASFIKEDASGSVPIVEFDSTILDKSDLVSVL